MAEDTDTKDSIQEVVSDMPDPFERLIQSIDRLATAAEDIASSLLALSSASKNQNKVSYSPDLTSYSKEDLLAMGLPPLDQDVSFEEFQIMMANRKKLFSKNLAPEFPPGEVPTPLGESID
jgi:hypothetical protein